MRKTHSVQSSLLLQIEIPKIHDSQTHQSDPQGQLLLEKSEANSENFLLSAKFARDRLVPRKCCKKGRETVSKEKDMLDNRLEHTHACTRASCT